jgi:RHS repeat-associated protein
VGIVYLDGLGRKIQEKSETIGGWITVDHYYDESGREFKTSLPYLSASSAYTAPAGTQITEVVFDPIGRVIETIKPDGKSYQAVYEKRGTLSVDEHLHVVSSHVWGTEKKEKVCTGNYPYEDEYSTTTILSRADGTKITDCNGNEIITALDMLGRKNSYDDLDMGLWTYEYDDNGNLISQTDAKEQTITMAYDCLNRLTRKALHGGGEVLYYYDEAGHGYAEGLLTRVVYAGGSESYDYDERGRITSTTQTIDGMSRTISFIYDSMDRVATETYPDGEVVTHSYEQNGNLDSVTGTSTYVSNIDYSVTAKVTQINYGNGLTTIYDYYDQADEYDGTAGTYFSQHLRRITLSTGSFDIMDIQYEYDAVGNVMIKNLVFRIEPGVEQPINENYTYDDLNRLHTAGSDMYGFKSYMYDEINNIIMKDGYTYQYNSSKPHAVTNDGQFSYTYDANGNMTTRSDGRTLTWDYENRLIAILESASTSTFSYNPEDLRLKKQITDTEGTFTVYYFFANYEEEYTDGALTNTIKYYYANGQRIAERSTENGLRFHHQDHLGSSMVIALADQSVNACLHYRPYGWVAYQDGTRDVRYKFTGKELDNSGLYYYGARYYDPVLGRFISPDPYLDGLNRYTYCGNNPIIYVDPSGNLFIIDDIFFAAVGAVSGAISGAVTAIVSSIGDGKNFFEVVGAGLAGVIAGAGTGAFQGYIGSAIAGPIGGCTGVVTGTLSSISIGTGIGAGVYHNPLTILSDMTWGALGSAIGGFIVTANTIQNWINPGTALLNYKASKEFGCLCYDTNKDHWISALGGRRGFGLGNVAHSWSIKQRYKELKEQYPWMSDEDCMQLAKKENHSTYLHESIHIGQQRWLGAVATIDLILEQAIPGVLSLFYGKSAFNYPYYHSFLLGLERNAFLHENDESIGGISNNPYSRLNRWRWW